MGSSRGPKGEPEVDVDVVNSGGCLPIDVAELDIADGEGVVATRVEILMLVNAIEHVGDELLEKQPRGNPDFPAEAAGDSGGEGCDVGVVDDDWDAWRGTDSVKVSDATAEFEQ